MTRNEYIAGVAAQSYSEYQAQEPYITHCVQAAIALADALEASGVAPWVTDPEPAAERFIEATMTQQERDAIAPGDWAKHIIVGTRERIAEVFGVGSQAITLRWGTLHYCVDKADILEVRKAVTHE